MYTTKNEIYFLVAPLRGGKQSLLCNSLLCNSLLCARRNERSYKKGFYKTFFNFSHKNSIHWIFMRELAPCRIKIKSCRIKIQLITCTKHTQHDVCLSFPWSFSSLSSNQKPANMRVARTHDSPLYTQTLCHVRGCKTIWLHSWDASLYYTRTTLLG